MLFERDRAEDFGAGGSEAAGQITDGHAENASHGGIANDADRSARPGDTVHAAARHIAGTHDEVGAVVGDRGEKARQVFWGVGQVGVHERQRVKRRAALGQRLGDAGPQRGGHPPIARVATDAQEWKARRELRQPKVGGVATAVVDRPSDQIEVKRGLVAYGFQTLEERRHVVCLVVHRQHDG